MAFLMERLRPVAAWRSAVGAASPAARSALVSGATAAGVGLAGVAVPVFLLWMVTPYVEGGAGSVVQLAACVWLLAQGAELTRLATQGGAVPVALAPLLVTALALVPLYRAGVRAGQRAAEPAGEREFAGPEREGSQREGSQREGSEREGSDREGSDREGPDRDEPGLEERAPVPAAWGAGGARPLLSAVFAVAGGYLLAALLLVAVAATAGELAVDPPAALGRVALAAVPVAALGVRVGAGAWGFAVPDWRRYRLPDGLRLPGGLRLPDALRRPDLLRLPGVLHRPGVLRMRAVLRVAGGGGVALRAALASAAALLGAGALVLVVSLVAHFGAAGTTAAQLAPDLAGRTALLLLCAALLPNAAVWAAAYALGPGFALGGQFGPLGAADVTTPAFPLLAALPGPGRPLLGMAALAAPVVVPVVLALLVGRAAAGTEMRGRWGLLDTAEVALAAAVGAAALAMLGADAAGGTLGTAALAQVGPPPWWTGVAVLAWASVGVPGALLVRWLYVRGLSRQAWSGEAWSGEGLGGESEWAVPGGGVDFAHGLGVDPAGDPSAGDDADHAGRRESGWGLALSLGRRPGPRSGRGFRHGPGDGSGRTFGEGFDRGSDEDLDLDLYLDFAPEPGPGRHGLSGGLDRTGRLDRFRPRTAWFSRRAGRATSEAAASRWWRSSSRRPW
ncbi:DUF6350 family protein [Streptacidiphilus sp. EB129]|uniref:cell division protein PerM n=1 Tax=Streptacidiphilus sp. EB129 TaxID=3156262 RepID=UPI0035182D4A